MNEESKKVNITRRLTLVVVLSYVLAMCIVLTAIPIYGWLYYGRRAIGFAKISTPTALYISAANKEAIANLDLSGIDVENGTPEEVGGVETGRLYQDFIFCIHGNHVLSYRMQLAYTTNNQFEFDVYPAALAANAGSVPGTAISHVTYVTHPESPSLPETLHYYVESSTSALAFTFLNRKSTSPEILAYTDNDTAAAGSKNYHGDTYEGYDEVHRYAEPIYCQTGTIDTVSDADANFADYYVLRVYWTGAAKNDKETDIIYISARNTTI